MIPLNTLLRSTLVNDSLFMFLSSTNFERPESISLKILGRFVALSQELQEPDRTVIESHAVVHGEEQAQQAWDQDTTFHEAKP